ncbi:hypothetical protein [Halobaculum sp. MBLA0143]|uniref:hypothetical protein n=1 Tax=Halobaculum sp. MBLA0143 TaxID=3079933 RepID=UPI003525C62F
MSESEEQTVTRGHESADSDTVRGENSVDSEGSLRFEQWEQWCDSYRSDFDGSYTERLRGLTKYAVTWGLLLGSTGSALGLTIHLLLAVLPVSLFGSFLGNVGAVVSIALAPWGAAVGGKINELFG